MAASFLSGCSLTPPPAFTPVTGGPKPTFSPSKQSRDAASYRSASYRSLSRALEKVDGKTISAWVNRWTAPGGAAPSPVFAPVRIDIEALARRHPAWILAGALERGTIAPTSPQIARVLGVAAPINPLQNGLESGQNDAKLQILPAKMLVAQGANRVGRDHQNAALDDFFAAAAARDALRGRDEAFLGRRTLEDAIAAQKGAVAELDLSLVPPEVALELTNLRLQLLRSLSKTPAQRAITRQEIRAIEERYNQIWRQETQRQADKVRASTLDGPLQQRREGLKNLENRLQSALQNRNGQRREVAADLKTRLTRDFSRARPAELHLTLPKTRGIEVGIERPNEKAAQFFETPRFALPSNPPRLNFATPSKNSSRKSQISRTIIEKLRAQARFQASKSARLLAAQWGQRWSDSPAAPDRTQDAIEALFFDASRNESQDASQAAPAGKADSRQPSRDGFG